MFPGLNPTPLLFAALLLFTALLLFAVPSSATEAPFHRLRLDSFHQAAPEIRFTDAGNAEHRLSEFIGAGHPAILHFWASWCTSCAKELPDLNDLAERAHDTGVIIVPISVDPPTNRPRVAAFLSRLAQSFPAWIVSHPEEAKTYWAWGLPITYFVDVKGVIVARALGSRSWSGVSKDELSMIFKKDK